ncbi:hypothetical protein V6N13_057789 [Hibiscus sabdariffa]
MFAAENGLKGDPRLQAISSAIRVVPHFPKQGLLLPLFYFSFLSLILSVYDFLERPLFKWGVCFSGKKTGIMFQDITTLLLDNKAFKHTVDIFVDRYRGMDISVVAGEVIAEAYELEYGSDCLEMHVGAVEAGERAIVIDDLVATGGTLSAAIRLLERVGAQVVECGCVIGLRQVKGQRRLNGKPLYILVEPREIDGCYY